MAYTKPEEDFEHVGVFLSTQVDHDNPALAREQMAEAESWLNRISYLKRQAEEEYRVEKNRYLLPKDKQYTDLDRETRLNANVAEIYRDFGYLEDIEKNLRTRVSVCQSILNSHNSELKSL